MSIDEQDAFVPLSLVTLTNHLFDLSKVLQGASSEDIVYFNNEDTKDTLTEFANSPLASSLFIFKFKPQIHEEAQQENERLWKVTLSINEELTGTPQSTIVIIKDKGVLSNSISLEKQLQVINLPTIGSSFETLKCLVSFGVGSYFDSITFDNNTEIVNSTKKKITELALSLEHLQQTIQVPDLTATVHPVLKDAIAKGADSSNFNEFIPDSTLMDPVFLNSMQAIVNEWFKSIQSITKNQREVSQESALDEVNFWISMESVLNSIQDQLNSTGVKMTLEILRYGKRFHATTGFLSDIGITQAFELTNDYNKLMKDLPINELITAQYIKKVEEATILIVSHLKKLRLTNYPITRAVPFIEAISSDVVSALKPHLCNLMELEYSDFKIKIDELNECLDTWDRQVKELTNLIRELVRKRGDKYLFVNVNSRTEPIKLIIREITNFRSSHEDFVKSVGENDLYLTQLDHAYDSVRGINPIEHTKLWTQSKRAYDKRLETVEDGIILDLRDSLNKTENSNDMFSVFQSFQRVLERPRIRGAVHEYQSQLLAVVKTEIQQLQTSFNAKVDFKPLSQLHDYPEIAFIVIWGKQIDAKLSFLLDRLELVLGSDWSSYAEGSKIHNEAVLFRKQIDVTPNFEKWLQNATGVTLTGEILNIVNDDHTVNLVLNFNDDLQRLFKETRALSLQGFKIPTQLIVNSRQIRKIYPHGIILKEALSTLNATLTKLDSLGEFSVLLLREKKDLYLYIIRALGTSWENVSLSQDLANSGYESSVSYHLDTIYKLEELINFISTHVDVLANLRVDFISMLEEFQTCEYKASAFAQIIERLQSLIYKVSLMGFANLDYVLEKANEFVLKALVDRYVAQGLQLKSMDHEIIVSSSITISPPLEQSKVSTIEYAQSMVQVIFDCPKMVLQNLDLSSHTLSNLDDVLPKILETHNQRLTVIEEDFQEAAVFAQSWSQFQVLWDLDSTDIYKKLNIEEWLVLLEEIKLLRLTFDSSDSCKGFKFTNIDFTNARDQVGTKFNLWSKDLLKYFANFLTGEMKRLLRTVNKGRKLLESVSVTLGSVKDIIATVNHVDYYTKLHQKVTENLSQLKSGESHLLKQRFRFSSDYIYIDQLEVEIESLLEIITRRRASIAENQVTIAKALEMESKAVEKSIADLSESWLVSKPVADTKDPEVALGVLNDFETKILAIEQHKKDVLAAIASLSLPFKIAESLTAIIGEIKDLKSVWISIQSLWSTLQDLRSTPWDGIKPRALRKQLEDLLTSTRSMPSIVKQHIPFQEFLSTILGLVNAQKTVLLLREDYIKDRHIKALFGSIGRAIPNEITIGSIWDLNLPLYQQFVDDVIQRAISERSIEESLEQIQDVWATASFELFVFNGFSVVKNFPQLIDSSRHHVESLQAMRSSAVFKIFERDIISWEDKLVKLYQILDSWVEVQRQWMDLYGVFDSKSGVQRLLPTESSRFHNISIEFTTILKRIFKSSLVIECQTIVDLSSVMERISDSLNKITKALSDFLEKQRDLFPRFYFIGNEDLLEIIGNMGDINRISRHFKKMFTGVSSVKFNESTRTIESVVSQDGEVIVLQTPVSLTQYPRLDEWMSQFEYQVKISLASLLKESLQSYDTKPLDEWFNIYPTQISLLTFQIKWTLLTEISIDKQAFESQQQVIENHLKELVELKSNNKKKSEALVIELVHHLDVVSSLRASGVSKKSHLQWSSQQRFYFDESTSDALESVKVHQGTKSFIYGFEFLGSMDRLVYTPLLSKCFVAMTGALDQGYGGSPFGPAGTGKTETVKALAQNLGKMSLVFNCDESFDFQAIGRLLLGICSIGGWGCFDEFNRLEFNILSAVSSQIEQIELGIRSKSRTITLLDKQSKLVNDTGIFITLNPDYTGRADLPDNLKKLFRSFSMQKPDSEIITEVLLRARGFGNAKELSSKIVHCFKELKVKLSNQHHYDFGLRSLKNTLEHAGKIKACLSEVSDDVSIIMKAANEILLPRLVNEDVNVFKAIQVETFGDVLTIEDEADLRQALISTASVHGLSSSKAWIEKVIQLYKVQNSQQGIILVGSSGSGKSQLWKSLFSSLSSIDDSEYIYHIIDPKTLSKSDLFGHLDPITREWIDGLFTGIIRKLNEDLRGEQSKKTWVVFDGDIDPDWVESLNSVLDDNKTLTLPNGERLKIPENLRFIFEVDSLSHATPATISRCGMVWVENGLVSADDVFKNELQKMRNGYIGLEKQEKSVHQEFAHVIVDLLPSDVLASLVEFSRTKIGHIMDVSPLALIRSLFVHIKSIIIRKISQESLTASSLTDSRFVRKCILLSIVWAFAGSANVHDRVEFFTYLSKFGKFGSMLPASDAPLNLLEYDVGRDGEWIGWNNFIEEKSLESHAVSDPNTVIQTVDTLVHENLIHSILQQRKSLILCGPPGAGKTMTLYAALGRSPDISVSNLNFSKETEPLAVLRALEQLCEYKRGPDGLFLKPKICGKRVVLFADELNLPKADAYGTQRVISFLRQMIEHGGFWRSRDRQWVKIQDIQFVGACNPAADAGRYAISQRFLNHVPIIMIDFPGKSSLFQIYKAFNYSILKNVPQLSGFATELTEAMLDVYFQSSTKFTTHNQIHYVYSPRELTRWVRGLYSAIQAGQFSTLNDLLRLWVHESVRLFSDRLVTSADKEWTWNMIVSVVQKRFPGLNIDIVLQTPILYSDWLSLDYESVDERSMSSFIRERFNVFSDEVLDIDFTLYEEAIDHILRIDRVLKQPQGHLILVGPSCSGKTTLTKFVAWTNGLNIQQLSVNRKYTLHDFDLCLKDVLKRTGVNGEKLCFILDESTILEGSFLERMNSLLANSQIQEIFDQDEYKILLNMCKEQVSSKGLLLDSPEELYEWFTQEVANNLHVVFTISDPTNKSSPQIVTSPALFNRCVLNWMGNWSYNSAVEVTSKLLQTSPIDKSDYVKPDGFEPVVLNSVASHRDAIVDCCIAIHNKFDVSPGKLIEFVNLFLRVFSSKENELKDYQRHINGGLIKLKETVLKVKQLNAELSEKESILQAKEKEARQVLDTILQEQSEAERRQEASIDIQGALEKQEVIIEEQRAKVMDDLALAEPAVLEARRGVKNIKKQHLTELRSMSSPPATVQLTLESVCVLLGYTVGSWRDVQKIIRKDDFIADMVNFNCEVQVTPDVRDYMNANYLSRPEYNFQSAFRASQACGPLLQWVEAQVKYSEVLEKIIPLKHHVHLLENDSIQTKARLSAIDDMVKELEDSISGYKLQYSTIIRDVEIIKQEMADVQFKVRHSMDLVEDLTAERMRWSKSIQEFDKQHGFIAGNSLLCAAFLTYSGKLNHKERDSFNKFTRSQLSSAGVVFDSNVLVTSFLNTPANLLEWESHGLSNDQLFFENVTIIENATKVPFIIDPFGQVANALKKKYAHKRVTFTSFLNDSFVRTLENSLRFGGHLLIEDAEYFDPIIAPILNNDFQKVGGRNLINIGGRSIDLSKDFKLYLHTSDQFVAISPFVQTRTTIVDFSITDSSLERQTVNMTLSSERPDVEKQRIEMIKLEGEYKVRFRELEDSLLTSLSESDGDLLQNDKLVQTLKSLKVESKEVEEKVRETGGVMSDIEKISNQYQPFAKASSLLFGIIKNLQILSHFYQFSLSSFAANIDTVLRIKASTDASDLSRVNQLIDELYKEVFSSFSISLMNKDKVVFALSIILIYISEKDGELFSKFVISLLTIFTDDVHTLEQVKEAFKLLSIDLSSENISELQNGNFSNIPVDVEEFRPLIMLIISDSQDIEVAIIELTKLLDSGNGSFASKYTLNDIVNNTKTTNPIILGSTPGYDPTFKVRNLALSSFIDLEIVALGSKEALDIATRELEKKSRVGGWLVIQNIQTSSKWLESLEKTLNNTMIHSSFRLFLTCDYNSLLPTTLLRSSNLISFENTPGLKSILNEYFVNSEAGKHASSEKTHLLFLLSWFHGIIQERSRLSPLGFTKKYTFNDSDFQCSEFYINTWFERNVNNSGHIAPEAIDFDTLKFYIADIAYGGKVDNESDLHVIKLIADSIFTASSFDIDFKLHTELSTLPEVKTFENFASWVAELPSLEPSTWLGLDADAEETVKFGENVQIIRDSVMLYQRLN